MADSPPTSRIARTRRFGGLVAGQGLRWAGTRAANTLRSDEAADAATGERAAATARELVKQLGQMRGAAMKIGQVLSTVDFTAIPESEREEFKATLARAARRRPAAALQARREAAARTSSASRSSDAFDDFEHDAFAAASIGQVHRATTTEGSAVAVKIQYPGIAEAVETDLRNLQLLLPLVKRLAPGLDVKALAQELRERIGDELDYEVEAQNHRAMARAWRGHPFVFVPPVDTSRSRRRVLVTEFLEGRALRGRSSSSTRPSATASARSSSASSSARSSTPRRAAGDPHPGNYLLLDDGRVGFLDFGLMRVVDADYLEGERALAQAVDARRRGGRPRAPGRRSATCPSPTRSTPSACSTRSAPPASGTSSPASAASRPAYVTDLIDRGSSPRSPFFERDAARDDPAAGAADPPHGGPRALDPRRAAGRRRLARARQRVLERRAAEHAARRAGRRSSGDLPDTRRASRR